MNTSAIGKWSTEDKFHAALETSTLTEQELAAYCRRKGLFVDDVKSWRKQCMNANGSNAKDSLEEAAALLVLQKKPERFGGITGKTDQCLRSRKSSKADRRFLEIRRSKAIG